MIESPLSEVIKAEKRNIKKLSVSRCDEDSAPAITSRLHNEAGEVFFEFDEQQHYV